MDINAYIESGILELYVAGALSDSEMQEVTELMAQHPEIKKEVLAIEAAVVKLTAAASPKASAYILAYIKERLGLGGRTAKVRTIGKARYDWVTYSGWAAAILLAVGLFWALTQNKDLENRYQTVEVEKTELEKEIETSRTDLEDTKEVLAALREKDVIKVPLAGQGNFQQTYASVFWDKKDNEVYIDAQGLPEPPPGKVYQVWSLTLSPLTPVSLGTIDNFIQDDNKIFRLANNNESEAFGITLEPEGGSEGPTMEQLYTLGTVASNP